MVPWVTVDPVVVLVVVLPDELALLQPPPPQPNRTAAKVKILIDVNNFMVVSYVDWKTSFDVDS